MIRAMKLAFLGTALLALATSLQAETLRLKSGALLVGDVEALESGDFEIHTRFPETATFTIKPDELTPRSLYDVIDRRSDPQDADARLRLGGLAESAGLYGIAVSDYLAVSDLRPALRGEMLERIEHVREAIAAGILEDARELLASGNPRGALMYLQTVRERYGKTKAAKEAKKLMATGLTQAGDSSDVAKKTVSEAKADKVITALNKDLQRGEREARKMGGHEGASSKDRKFAERAIRSFEAAWRKVKTLPVAAVDEELNGLIRSLRLSTKQRLAKAYLTAGYIHLQDYSIPRAEEYCNKACELMPEDKSKHRLHQLIIEAKINGGNRWGNG